VHTPVLLKKHRLTCLAVLLFCANALASPSVRISPAPSWIVPVSPAGKAPSSREFSDGYYIAFSDNQVNLDKKTTYFRSIRQIVTETGIQNASEISVSFEPSYEQIEFHNITVWRDGKPIPKLKISDFKVLPLETDRQRFIYNGVYSASLILSDIRKGDKIEYSFSRTGWNPVFNNMYSRMLDFWTSDYVQHTHFALLVPGGRKVFFKEFNSPPKKTTRNVNGNVVYEWDLKDFKYVEYEDYSPSWYYKEPFVQVAEFKDWAEVVKWGVQYYQVPPVTGALKAKVEEWKKSADSQHRYIQLASRFVQDEIRYLGIETGQNSHRPHDPGLVFNQRYGDCKDKAFLLCAILRANNIECDPVLVNTYKRSHLSEYLPSPAVFNHVVCRVKSDEKRFTFIDATYSLQGGTTSTIFFPAYGQGLVLKPGQTSVIDIPDQNPGGISMTEEVTLPGDSDATKEGSMMVKTVYFGSEADNIRSTFQESSRSKIEEDYLNYYKDVFKKVGIEAKDTLEYYDQREANNVSVLEHYKMAKPWQFDSARNHHYFTIFGKNLYSQLVILPDRNRKSPVSLQFPYSMDYTIRLHMGSLKNITEEKWEIKRDAYIISFTSELNEAENAWELCYVYKTLRDHVAVEQIGQFKDDMNKLVQSLEWEFKNSDGADDSSNADYNYWMILFRMACFGLGIYLCVRLYGYSPGTRFVARIGTPIGGWLILLAAILILQPFAIFFSFFDENLAYVTVNGWNSMEGQSALMSIGYRALLVIECLVNALLFCGSVFLLVLFFNKRDSFPRVFSVFFLFKLVFTIVDAVIIRLFFEPVTMQNPPVGNIVSVFLFCAIWVSYLNGSPRVDNTFINTKSAGTRNDYPTG
jgi:hypothetical protein